MLTLVQLSLARPPLPHKRKGLVTLALQICSAEMQLSNDITTMAIAIEITHQTTKKIKYIDLSNTLLTTICSLYHISSSR